MTDGERGRCAVVANPVKVSDGFQGAVTEALREGGWGEPLWLETTENDPGRSMAATAVAEREARDEARAARKHYTELRRAAAAAEQAAKRAEEAL